jgi:hypothetical protein
MRYVAGTLLLTLLLGLAAGCVSRELYITSEPEGASVLINDTYRGTTPMTHRFVHYQTFGIRLEKEGYHPLYVEETVSPPLYEQPGVDLISEAFWPGHLKDRREFKYTLEEVTGVDPLEEVIGRAEERREELREAVEARAERARERDPLELPLPVKESVREREEAAAAEQAETEAETDGDAEAADDEADGEGSPADADTDDREEAAAAPETGADEPPAAD